MSVRGGIAMKKFLKILLIIILVLVLVVGAYVAYVFLSFKRIPDNQKLTVDNPAGVEKQISAGEEHNITSWNIGFAAYLRDYSFFMDGGVESRARSKEAVLDSMEHIGEQLESLKSDIYYVQEVDFDSTRAYKVDERELIRQKFNNLSYVFAQNYDSPYLFWPLTSPHGANKSSIVTLSKYQMTDSLRRSLPIQTNVAKVLDLDRCYSVTKVPTNNGKELVLINFHLSAYTTDPTIGNQQLEMIYKTVEEEYNKGNYVICGGDFNKDLLGNCTELFGVKTEQSESWCKPFPKEDLPGFMELVAPYDEKNPVATCRSAGEPYELGKTVRYTLDGFMVTDNVEVKDIKAIDADFNYSDHNPVNMTFKLK